MGDDAEMLEELLRTAPQRGGWTADAVDIRNDHAILAAEPTDADNTPDVDQLKKRMASALRGYTSNIQDRFPPVEEVVKTDSAHDTPRRAKGNKTQKLRKQSEIGHKEWVVERENPDKPDQLTADVLLRTADAGPAPDEWLSEEDAAPEVGH
jgi:hypothetical protein